MASPRQQPFYQPLDNPGKQIRLIEILSESPDEKVSCKLHTVSLDAKPYYICLSYVWGDPSITDEILVNGVPTQVTVNLAAALKHAKTHWISIQNESGNEFNPSDFRIWADAICINQDDLLERMAQVQLMGSLYSSGDFALAWLSSLDENFADILATLRRVFDALGARFETSGYPLPDLNGPEWAGNTLIIERVLKQCQDNQEIDPMNYAFDVESLEAFVDSPFWTRIWIQQEIALAPNVYYACPTVTISHGKLYVALDTLSQSLRNQAYLTEESPHELQIIYLVRKLDRIFGRLLVRFSAHLPSENSQLLTRVKVLADTFRGELEATRPVDYVYGLLSLSGLDIVPDYSKATRDVWIELVAKYLEIFEAERRDSGAQTGPAREFERHQGILHCIQLCAAGLRRDQNLPTWAPVLSPSRRRDHRYPISNLGSKVYMGLLELHDCPDPRVVDDSLWVTAAKVQTVSSCDKEPLNFMPLEDFPRAVAAQFESFLESHGPTYVNGQPLLTVLCSTLFDQEDGVCTLERFHYMISGNDQLAPRLREQMILDGLKSESIQVIESHLSEWVAKEGYFSGQRFICTEDGYIGLAGAEVQPGDAVCIITDLNQPVILRPEGDHYLLVDCCFMLGLMSGEVVDLVKAGRAKIEVIEIK
ncbi:hypothetical protein ACHAPT_010834 [Fusarium lateritium]